MNIHSHMQVDMDPVGIWGTQPVALPGSLLPSMAGLGREELEGDGLAGWDPVLCMSPLSTHLL